MAPLMVVRGCVGPCCFELVGVPGRQLKTPGSVCCAHGSVAGPAGTMLNEGEQHRVLRPTGRWHLRGLLCSLL
jgi:hypothetical protein